MIGDFRNVGYNHKLRMKQALFTPTDLEILQRYIDLGIRYAFAVPCSITDTWTQFACDATKQSLWSFNLTNHEGNLAGLAAGVFLGTGQPALIQLQNSGLPSIGDGLISMANRKVCGIPLVLLVTHRGSDGDDDSEPHQEIGRRTEALITTIVDDSGQVFSVAKKQDRLKRSFEHLASSSSLESAMLVLNGELEGGLLSQLDRSVAVAKHNEIGVLILKEKDFKKTATTRCLSSQFGRIQDIAPPSVKLQRPVPISFARPVDRDTAIRAIAEVHPDAAMVFCNGYTARAALAVADRPSNFYNVGYMGGTLAIGWSIAKCRPDLEVVVIDGDQNALMSTMTPHLWLDYPLNLYWYILDNQMGASVGGAPSLPLPAILQQLAYRIETISDPPGSFKHPRVSADRASFESQPPPSMLGHLTSLTWRFREWVDCHHGKAGSNTK
ncbi:MAG: hypothetical protein ACKO24_14610 [Leptolyngbyaceae cyanobacterium]